GGSSRRARRGGRQAVTMSPATSLAQRRRLPPSRRYTDRDIPDEGQGLEAGADRPPPAARHAASTPVADGAQVGRLSGTRCGGEEAMVLGHLCLLTERRAPSPPARLRRQTTSFPDPSA